MTGLDVIEVNVNVVDVKRKSNMKRFCYHARPS